MASKRIDAEWLAMKARRAEEKELRDMRRANREARRVAKDQAEEAKELQVANDKAKALWREACDAARAKWLPIVRVKAGVPDGAEPTAYQVKVINRLTREKQAKINATWPGPGPAPILKGRPGHAPGAGPVRVVVRFDPMAKNPRMAKRVHVVLPPQTKAEYLAGVKVHYAALGRPCPDLTTLPLPPGVV